MKQSIYNMTLEGIQAYLTENSLSPNLAEMIMGALYNHGTNKLTVEEGFSERLITKLKIDFDFSLPKIVTTQVAEDGTTKFLSELADGQRVETVLIPFHQKYSVCLSSQVGCKMNCSFCHTGTQGFSRDLTPAEIIGQYLIAWKWQLDHDKNVLCKPSIVFMGQGEPLDNFDSIKKAIEVLLTPSGAHLGPRQITLSTAGVVPSIERFNELHGINIALSLHSAIDETRSELIPLNRKWNLDSLFSALDNVKLKKRQYITCEYLLIDGLNDDLKHIDALEKLIESRQVIINLIPFNEFPGTNFKRPSKEKVEWFKERLVERKVRTMIRTTKGDDILAACGQLKSNS